jgi:hypothetical protein
MTPTCCLGPKCFKLNACSCIIIIDTIIHHIHYNDAYYYDAYLLPGSEMLQTECLGGAGAHPYRYVYVYVYMYVCMYVYMCICVLVCMYVCMYAWEELALTPIGIC